MTEELATSPQHGGHASQTIYLFFEEIARLARAYMYESGSTDYTKSSKN